MNENDSRDWLGLAGKNVLVTGFKNKKSVAWRVGRRLRAAGASVIWSVHTRERLESLREVLAADERGTEGERALALVCDVEDRAQIDALERELATREIRLDGLVHSIAYAIYA